MLPDHLWIALSIICIVFVRQATVRQYKPRVPGLVIFMYAEHDCMWSAKVGYFDREKPLHPFEPVFELRREHWNTGEKVEDMLRTYFPDAWIVK